MCLIWVFAHGIFSLSLCIVIFSTAYKYVCILAVIKHNLSVTLCFSPATMSSFLFHSSFFKKCLSHLLPTFPGHTQTRLGATTMPPAALTDVYKNLLVHGPVEKSRSCSSVVNLFMAFSFDKINTPSFLSRKGTLWVFHLLRFLKNLHNKLNNTKTHEEKVSTLLLLVFSLPTWGIFCIVSAHINT